MDQANTHFNAGKIKQALSQLQSHHNATDSVEPNIAICEHLVNRCTLTRNECLKKLSDLLQRKQKRDSETKDDQTDLIIKFNIAVLQSHSQHKETALMMLEWVVKDRSYTIAFLQQRMFLLLMETNLLLKREIEVLRLFQKENIQLRASCTTTSQWISLSYHESSRTAAVCPQQYNFTSYVILGQAFMRLGVPIEMARPVAQIKDLKDQILKSVEKRKPISRYYQFNIFLMSHFYEAQFWYRSCNIPRALVLLTVPSIHEAYKDMPNTKIIVNIVSSFCNNNSAIIYASLGKSHLALSHFMRAKQLMAKASTGVQDRQLHLFATNSVSQSELINYNIALAALDAQSRQSHELMLSAKRANPMSRNYKFWYRIGQSALSYYFEHPLTKQQELQTLTTALQAFRSCLTLLEAHTVLDASDQQSTRCIPSDVHSNMVRHARREYEQFYKSTKQCICYVYLCLNEYQAVIKEVDGLLSNGAYKLNPKDEATFLCYYLEARRKLRLDEYISNISWNKKQNQQPPNNPTVKQPAPASLKSPRNSDLSHKNPISQDSASPKQPIKQDSITEIYQRLSQLFLFNPNQINGHMSMLIHFTNDSSWNRSSDQHEVPNLFYIPATQLIYYHNPNYMQGMRYINPLCIPGVLAQSNHKQPTACTQQSQHLKSQHTYHLGYRHFHSHPRFKLANFQEDLALVALTEPKQIIIPKNYYGTSAYCTRQGHANTLHEAQRREKALIYGPAYPCISKWWNICDERDGQFGNGQFVASGTGHVQGGYTLQSIMSASSLRG